VSALPHTREVRTPISVAETIRRDEVGLSPRDQLNRVRRGVVEHLNLSPTADPLQVAFDQFKVERTVLYVALYDLMLAYAEELRRVDLNEVRRASHDPDLARGKTVFAEPSAPTDPTVVAWLEKLMAFEPSKYWYEISTYDDKHILPWSFRHAQAELKAIDQIAARLKSDPALGAAAELSNEQLARRFLAARALTSAAAAAGLVPEHLDETTNRILHKARVFGSRRVTWLTELQTNASTSRGDIINSVLSFHRAAVDEDLSPADELIAFRASLPALCERANGPMKRFRRVNARDGFTWDVLAGTMIPDKPLDGVPRFRWARLKPAGTRLLGNCPAMNAWPDAFDLPPLISAVLDVGAQLAVESIFPFADNGVLRADYGVSCVAQRHGPALLCD
jgi:hypothetical protein